MSQFNTSAAAVRLPYAALCLLAAASLSWSQPVAANQSPSIVGQPVTTATVGLPYSFRLPVTDPDGAALTFSIQNKPDWATFNTLTGVLAGIPGATDVGASQIVMTVSDGQTGASLAFPLTVVQPPPSQPVYIFGQPQTSATVGSLYSFQLGASGGDGNPLTFTIQNKPAWATFDSQTGLLSGTPDAADVGVDAGIVVGVSDGIDSALLGFDLTVAQIGNESLTISWTPPNENTDGSVLTNLAGYYLYYGTTPTTLDHTITITNAGLTRYVVDNLTPVRWYFAVAAYNSVGAQSDRTRVIGMVPQ